MVNALCAEGSSRLAHQRCRQWPSSCMNAGNSANAVGRVAGGANVFSLVVLALQCWLVALRGLDVVRVGSILNTVAWVGG